MSEVEQNQPLDPAVPPQPEPATSPSDGDTVGKPRPVQGGSSLPLLLTEAVCLMAAGGVVLFLVGGSAGMTRGSTRSARLKWEARQQQTQQVANNQECSTQPAASIQEPVEPQHR